MKYFLAVIFAFIFSNSLIAQKHQLSGGIGRAQFATGDIPAMHWRLNYDRKVKGRFSVNAGINYTQGSRDLIGLGLLDRPLTLSSPDNSCPFDGLICFGIDFSAYSKLLATKTARSSEFNFDLGIQYNILQKSGFELGLGAGVHVGKLDYYSISAVVPGTFDIALLGETNISLIIPVAFRAIDWGHHYSLSAHKYFKNNIFIGLVTDTHFYFSGDRIYSVSLISGIRF